LIGLRKKEKILERRGGGKAVPSIFGVGEGGEAIADRNCWRFCEWGSGKKSLKWGVAFGCLFFEDHERKHREKWSAVLERLSKINLMREKSKERLFLGV